MFARIAVGFLRAAFAAPDRPAGRSRLDPMKFDLGVCPGCRGLRAVASPLCQTCGSAAPVTADA